MEERKVRISLELDIKGKNIHDILFKAAKAILEHLDEDNVCELVTDENRNVN